MKYVIERKNGTTREWWTGSGWSDVDTDAAWYAARPDAVGITCDTTASATAFDVAPAPEHWDDDERSAL